MPAPDGGDNLIGIGLPDKRPGFLIMLFDEAVDGGLESDDGVKHAAFQPSVGQLGEEALDGVQPGTRRRHEVEGPARMPGKPGADLGLFMGGVVVEDDVTALSDGSSAFTAFRNRMNS